MPSELSPGGSNARMTPAQIKRHLKKMKEAEAIAKEKIRKAKESGEYYAGGMSEDELEDMLDDVV